MTAYATPVDDVDSITAFADSAEALLTSKSPLTRIRSLRDQVPRFERRFWAQLAEAGWSAILVPEDLGGLGLALHHACAVAEQVGRHPLPEPFIGAAVQTVSLLTSLPATGLRDRLLGCVVSGSGDAVIGVAWQERAGQLEPDEALAVRATRDAADGHRLRGVKRWVVPGTGADGWLVSGCAEDGPGIWWVPAGTVGVAVREDARIDGSTSATLSFDGAEVPESCRLAAGDEALEALRVSVDTARMAQAAELLGNARQVFEMTLEYLKTRIQFENPIGANQALQHRMVDAYIQIELASASLEEALRDAMRDPWKLAAAASRAKARCARTALRVARLGMQFHGAIGYTDEYDLGLYLKRAIQLASWLGNEQAMRLRHRERSPAGVDAFESGESGPAPEPVRDADWNSMSEAGFRWMVRAFLRRHYPDELRHPPHRLRWHECKDWYMTLARQGWLAPAWPRVHGGMELPGDKLVAFIEEMEDYGVARLPDQGLINLGPVLIRFGSPEQQREYLPKILSGEHVWCQGYSEPNAGSDLASLRTEAVVDGDDFLVNGQKIWTTLAQDATHIFLLVRTDKTAKKQAGISFLLVDMSSPGVSVRPIRNIAGEEEFCEVFFDNVRVPRRNLVGELNKGWTIAKSLLGFERLFVGSPKTAQYALSLLRKLADARGLFAQASFVARWAELELDVADLKAAYGRFAEIVKRGGELPASVSILKIWASETYTAITRLMLEACDEEGGALGEIDFGGSSVNLGAPLLNAMITTIYAGSNEIQRNILAKAVLKLPG